MILFGIFWIVLLQLGGRSDFLYLLSIICAVIGIIFCITGVLTLYGFTSSRRKSKTEDKKNNFIADNEYSSGKSNNK